MDIAFAHHCGRVAEEAADLLGNTSEYASAFRASPSRIFDEALKRHDRSMEGAEILGRDVALGDIGKIAVEIIRGHIPPAGFRHELEDTSARNADEVGNVARNLSIGDARSDAFASLARKVEAQCLTRKPQMLAQEGRHAAAALLTGIFLMASAQAEAIDKPGSGRKNAAIVRAIEIAGNGPAQAWKSLDQTPQPLGLLGAPYRLPFRVIDILAPACLVAPDGLDMAMRIGTDPHVSPCRRNNQFLNSADVALS